MLHTVIIIAAITALPSVWVGVRRLITGGGWPAALLTALSCLAAATYTGCTCI